MKDTIKGRSKAHTRYYTKDGVLVPGVTTITSLEGGEKGQILCGWANGLGLEGVKYSEYMRNVSNLGTLVHYRAECFLTGEKPDFSLYSPTELAESEISYKKFVWWVMSHKDFKLIFVEKPLVSEKYGFGGTIDLYCEINGVKTLVDIKTSNACREEHKVQVSAYEQLMNENVHLIEDVKILRVGRKENDGFEIIDVPQRETRFKKFVYLLAVYKLNNTLKQGG